MTVALSPQGLFEIAARTYRSRASVAASLDDDGAEDAGISTWDMATDIESSQLAATGIDAQMLPGGQRLVASA